MRDIVWIRLTYQFIEDKNEMEFFPTPKKIVVKNMKIFFQDQNITLKVYTEDMFHA